MKKRQTILFFIALAGVILTGYIMDFSAMGQSLLKTYGDGTGMLDFRYFYTPSQAQSAITQLGDGGMAVYKTLLYIDFVFILSLAYAMSYLMKSMILRLKLPGKLAKISGIAYIRGIFDCAENIILLLCLYGNSTFLFLGGIATALKWLTMGVYFAALAFLAGYAVYRKIKAKKEQ